MRHRKVLGILGLTVIVSLCGCSDNSKQGIDDQDTEATSESIMESIVAETNDKDNKDKNKDKNNDKSILETLDINSIENVGITIEDPANIELEEIPHTSGKVVDTYVDFSIYGLESTGNNDTLTLFDGDDQKYLYELNNYITNSFIIKASRITRYLDDENYSKNYNTTVESDIHDVQIAMEALDAKNTVINSYFTHEPSLVSSWNKFYQEVILLKSDILNLNKSNVDELNITSVVNEASAVASILSSKTKGYGIVTSDSIKAYQEVTSLDSELEQQNEQD